MKAIRFLLIGLVSGLTACSYTFTVDLGNQTLDLSNLPPVPPENSAFVIYAAAPRTFTPPPLDVVRGLRVVGEARANQPLVLTLHVYGRLQDPAQDPSCQVFSGIALCSAAPGEALGTLAFQGSDRTSFTLSGQTLLEGVRQGRLWLGVAPEGALPPGLSQIHLEGLKAYVTVGL